MAKRAPTILTTIVYLSSFVSPVSQTLFSHTKPALELEYLNVRDISFYSRAGNKIEEILAMWSEPVVVAMDEVAQGHLEKHIATTPSLLSSCPECTFLYPLQPNLNLSIYQQESNYAQIHVRMDIVSYVAGYVAASISSNNALGFLIPTSDLSNHIILNAWALGAQRAKSNVKVYFASLDDNQGNTEETVRGALKLFQHWSCDVVSGTIHASHLYTVAQELGMKTTGFAYDWRSLLGYEGILLSTRRQFTQLLQTALHEKFSTGHLTTFRHISDPFSNTDTSSSITDFSPLVPGSTQDAAHALLTNLEQQNENIWCGPLLDSNSQVRIPSGQCRTYEQLIDEPVPEWNGVKGSHNLGVYRNPSVHCRAGMFYLYDIDTNQLSCHLCREGFYAVSPMEGSCNACSENSVSRAGSSECTKCANGTNVASNAMQCYAPFPIYLIFIAVIGVLVLALIISVPALFILLYLKRRHQLTLAPKQGECTLLAMNIDQVLHLRDSYEYDMSTAQIHLDRLISMRLKKHKGYLSTFSRKDGYLFAFNNYADCISFACYLQLDLLKIEWPDSFSHSSICPNITSPDGDYIFRGPRLKMGILTATPLYSFSRLTFKMAYFGTNVVLVRQLMEAACGGRILSTIRCLDLLQSDLDAARDIRIKYKMQHRMQFVGVKKAIRLVEFIAAELEEREFPPLGNVSGGFLFKVEEDQLDDTFVDIENEDYLSSITGRDFLKPRYSFTNDGSSQDSSLIKMQDRKASMASTTSSNPDTVTQSGVSRISTNKISTSTTLRDSINQFSDLQNILGGTSHLAQPNNVPQSFFQNNSSFSMPQYQSSPLASHQQQLNQQVMIQPPTQIEHEFIHATEPQIASNVLINGDKVYFATRSNMVLKVENGSVIVAPFQPTGLKHIFTVEKVEGQHSNPHLPPSLTSFEIVTLKSLFTSAFVQWADDGFRCTYSGDIKSGGPLLCLQLVKTESTPFEIHDGDMLHIKSPQTGLYVSCNSRGKLSLLNVFDPIEEEELRIHRV
eukprot:CAMPEP_0117436852 /NCGR_PEP_ID=MMETSP0759-20121206/1220_1 /TAXON_ID=63605 /ORGANISM="Percolomonas cosmopolitus, Strain WS" /LENGTH=1014 /DNA_ID=CAMNT_0005228463 /DNA_START=283 /DNA_END=3327 /DNA_ORIENTATION=+